MIKNGNSENRYLLSSAIANGITKTEIVTIIIIQFALMFFSFCSIGLKENKTPNGIKTIKYGYKIEYRTLNKFASPYTNLSNNTEIPYFSTKFTIPGSPWENIPA